MDLINDPNIINKAAAQFNAGQQPMAKVDTTPPSRDTEVELPGGFLTPEGNLVNAFVRELNGFDEERIMASPNQGAALWTVLRSGLVSLGGKSVTEDDLNQMLMGDIEATLLGIYRATFGDTVSYVYSCACGQTSRNSVDLTKELVYKTLDNPISDRIFSIEGRVGVLTVALPNGNTYRNLQENLNKGISELANTILVGCILSVNGEPAMGPVTAKSLGLADRELVIDEIYKRNPGPRLGEVSKACEACGANYYAPLSLAALFRV